MRTPNDFVYGETNRYPIYINSPVRYWFKLIQMEEFRIPRKAYKMLFALDLRGKTNWVTGVRNCLCKYGFGEVWQNQGVGNEKEIIRLFRQRLIDCRWQEWNNHISNSERFSLYRTLSSIHEAKMYLMLDMDRVLKNVITKFRFGVSDLAIHHYRYRNASGVDLVCPLCAKDKDDEVHFILCCPVLGEIRARYIPAKYYRDPCLFKVSLLMSSTRQSDVWGLAIFF